MVTKEVLTLAKDLLEVAKQAMDEGQPTTLMKDVGGICGYLRRGVEIAELPTVGYFDVYGALSKLWVDWEHCSGNSLYPIPSADPLRDAQGRYDYTWICEEAQWDKQHPYAALRYDLICHLINKLEGLINGQD